MSATDKGFVCRQASKTHRKWFRNRFTTLPCQTQHTHMSIQHIEQLKVKLTLMKFSTVDIVDIKGAPAAPARQFLTSHPSLT